MSLYVWVMDLHVNVPTIDPLIDNVTANVTNNCIIRLNTVSLSLSLVAEVVSNTSLTYTGNVTFEDSLGPHLATVGGYDTLQIKITYNSDLPAVLGQIFDPAIPNHLLASFTALEDQGIPPAFTVTLTSSLIVDTGNTASAVDVTDTGANDYTNYYVTLDSAPAVDSDGNELSTFIPPPTWTWTTAPPIIVVSEQRVDMPHSLLAIGGFQHAEDTLSGMTASSGPVSSTMLALTRNAHGYIVAATVQSATARYKAVSLSNLHADQGASDWTNTGSAAQAVALISDPSGTVILVTRPAMARVLIPN